MITASDRIPYALRAWQRARPEHRTVEITTRMEVVLSERGTGRCRCRTTNIAVFLVASGSMPWVDRPVAGSRMSRARRGGRA